MGQCSSKNKSTKGLFSKQQHMQGQEGKPPVRESIWHMEKEMAIRQIKACLEMKSFVLKQQDL